MIINKNLLVSTNSCAKDLVLAKNTIYDPYGFKYSNLEIEQEGHLYSACHFELNDYTIFFRVSKITPTKTGQFATFWKRSENRTI